MVDELKYNLWSISQLYDKGLRVLFDDSTCDVLDKKWNICVLSDFRENNVYMIGMLNFECNATFLNAFNEASWLSHGRLGYISFDHLSRINSKESVKGFPNLKFEKNVFVMCANLGNKLSFQIN